MQPNSLIQIVKTMPEVNAAIRRLSVVLLHRGEILSAQGSELVSLADNATEASLERAEVVFKESADSLLSLGSEISEELPQLREKIGVIERNAPHISEGLDLSSPTVKREGTEALDQLIRLINSWDTCVNQMEDFRQKVEALNGISPEIDAACVALMSTIDDLRAVFNQNWFSYRDMAEGFKRSLR